MTHDAHDQPAPAEGEAVMACPNIDVTSNDLAALIKLLTHGKFGKPRVITSPAYCLGFKMPADPPVLGTVRFKGNGCNPDGNRATITSVSVTTEGVTVEVRRVDGAGPGGRGEDRPISAVLAVDVPL